MCNHANATKLPKGKESEAGPTHSGAVADHHDGSCRPAPAILKWASSQVRRQGPCPRRPDRTGPGQSAPGQRGAAGWVEGIRKCFLEEALQRRACPALTAPHFLTTRAGREVLGHHGVKAGLPRWTAGALGGALCLLPPIFPVLFQCFLTPSGHWARSRRVGRRMRVGGRGWRWEEAGSGRGRWG